MQAANSKLKNIIRSTAHTLCHNLSPSSPTEYLRHSAAWRAATAATCSSVQCCARLALSWISATWWCNWSSLNGSFRLFFLSRTPKLNRTPKSKQRSNLTLHNGSQTVSNCSRQRFPAAAFASSYTRGHVRKQVFRLTVSCCQDELLYIRNACRINAPTNSSGYSLSLFLGLPLSGVTRVG